MLTNLATVYETNTFSWTGLTWNQWSPNEGEALIERSVLADHGDGRKELYLYKNDSSDWIPGEYSGVQVPTNSPIGTLCNVRMYYRNSFYWDARHYAQLSTNDMYTFSTNDFRLARRRQYLHGHDSADIRDVSDLLNFEWAAPLDAERDGQMTWYDYDNKDNVDRQGPTRLPGAILQIRPDGVTNSTFYTWYVRDSRGFPTNVITTYTQSDGSLAQRTNAYVYGSSMNEVIRMTNALGQLSVSNSYSADSRVLTNYNAVNEMTTNFWNGNQQMTDQRTPAGLNTHKYYDASGFMTQEVRVEISWTNNFTYTNGMVYTKTDERGLTTTNTWDALDRLTSTRFPDGSYISNVYTKLDLTASRDRLGNWTYFGYDHRRQKTSETNALGKITKFGYSDCDCGQVTAMTNAVAEVTTSTYNLNGDLVQITRPGNISITNTLDRLRRISVQANSYGLVTNYFNSQGLSVATSNFFGQLVRTNYDVLDRATNIVDANGVSITQTFDALGRVLTKTYPDAGVERLVYTAKGLVAYTNQISQRTLYDYDEAGRKIAETNANSHVTLFAFDPSGNLTNLTDARSKMTRWKYDEYNRLTNKLDHLGTNAYVYSYDAMGRMTNRLDAMSHNTAYRYDAVGNPINVIYPSLTNVFAYDDANRLTLMSNSILGACSYTYGTNGLLGSEDGPWAEDTISFTYNGVGDRASLSILNPNAATWSQTYAYDAAGRFSTITALHGTATYTYSGPGSLPINHNLPNTSNITNTYDSNSRLTGTYLKNSSGTTLNSHTYGYNQGNQRTNQTRTDGSYVAYS